METNTGIYKGRNNIFVGGIGNPWYIKDLISEHEEMNIVIYEPSKEIFFTVLETIDITDFFKKKANCIFIVDGVSGVKIDDIIKKIDFSGSNGSHKNLYTAKL